MKKFNPEEELRKIQNKNITINSASRIKGSYIPALLLACFGVAILGTTISNGLSMEDNNFYTVNIDIINGQQSQYIKKVSAGEFSAVIENDATFGSINCTKGTLSYDPETSRVYSNNINEDTECILSFMNDGTKNIQISQLNRISDNNGKSYYYKADAKNNYIKLGDTMFRIVRINGDGSYRLITEKSLDATTFGSNNDYVNSNIKDILNNWVQKFENYNLVEEDFDINNYQGLELDTLIAEYSYINSKVGLLNVREAYLITDGITDGYLSGSFFLSNGYGLENVWAIKDGVITNTSIYDTLNIRPVINIKPNSIKGQGTEELPYEIG